MQVWAGMRKSSSRNWLKYEGLQFQTLDLTNAELLRSELSDFAKEHGKWDIVIHAAGATKCLHASDFDRNNFECTVNLVECLRKLDMQPRLFVYVSSLSVLGAIREKDYSEMKADDTPQPNTEYGRSKLAAEQYLESIALRLPYIILRPTGVYGPREKDYYMMAKTIKQHSDFAVGFKRQDITFVYVTDVVQAVFLALEKGENGRKFFLSDGEVYQSSTFSDLIHEELGRPWWIRVTAPEWILRIITFFGEHIGRMTGKVTALNNDKYNILRQRNWRCDIQPAIDELGYKPTVKLAEGVKRTIKWYKDNGWL
jgi:nucleoside-diphosphate-sugar epimerase